MLDPRGRRQDVQGHDQDLERPGDRGTEQGRQAAQRRRSRCSSAVDESGTTENFQKYLAGAGGGAWTDEPSKVWPGAGEGREKSSGVADGVKTTPNSITYVEWSYAKDNNLGIAKVDNGAGPVELTGESVGTAVASAKSVGTGNDLRLELDYATKTAGAYPIVLVTYEIACSKGLPADKAELVKSFLTFFSSAETQASLEEIGYAPLPDEVQTKVATAVEALELTAISPEPSDALPGAGTRRAGRPSRAPYRSSREARTMTTTAPPDQRRGRRPTRRRGRCSPGAAPAGAATRRSRRRPRCQPRSSSCWWR